MSDPDSDCGGEDTYVQERIESCVEEPETPAKWTGGTPYHAGGGTINREWVCKERKLMVGYMVGELTVSLCRVRWDDINEFWMPVSHPITWFEAPNEEEACALAQWLMERVLDGEYDEKLAKIDA